MSRFMNGIIPMNGKIGATCRPPVASCTSGVYRLLGTDDWRAASCPPWRLPMDWAIPTIGLIGQLAARRLRVALPGRLPMDWPFNGY